MQATATRVQKIILLVLDIFAGEERHQIVLGVVFTKTFDYLNTFHDREILLQKHTDVSRQLKAR
jgi:hypothetical protein